MDKLGSAIEDRLTKKITKKLKQEGVSTPEEKSIKAIEQHKVSMVKCTMLMMDSFLPEISEKAYLTLENGGTYDESVKAYTSYIKKKIKQKNKKIANNVKKSLSLWETCIDKLKF